MTTLFRRRLAALSSDIRHIHIPMKNSRPHPKHTSTQVDTLIKHFPLRSHLYRLLQVSSLDEQQRNGNGREKILSIISVISLIICRSLTLAKFNFDVSRMVGAQRNGNLSPAEWRCLCVRVRDEKITQILFTLAEISSPLRLRRSPDLLIIYPWIKFGSPTPKLESIINENLFNIQRMYHIVKARLY